MKSTVIYPGTFDPITLGHADLVMRATQLFDRVILAVAGSTAKQTLFDIDQRVQLAREALQGLERVQVSSFDGLLVEFARRQGVTAILRGLRAVSDYEYELQLAGMNRRLVPEVDTVFLTPAEQYAFLSSSLVREVASLGGDVREFVHPAVYTALTDRLSG